jgi:hypothetical protein
MRINLILKFDESMQTYVQNMSIISNKRCKRLDFTMDSVVIKGKQFNI